MDKKTYYITIESGEILEDPTVTPYEFEIIASPEEKNELQQLFDQVPPQEFANYIDAHIPFKPYHEDKTNDAYDHSLLQIYQKIYELGNTKTRRFIEEEKILDAIKEIPENGSMELRKEKTTQ